MKTIRTNCFETNSSSTHSFTLCIPSKDKKRPTQTVLPNEEGIIQVPISSCEGEGGVLSKIALLLSIAYYIGDQEGFDRVKKVVTDFTKLPVKAVLTERDYSTKPVTITTSEVTKVKQYAEAAVVEDSDEYDDDEESSEMLDFISDDFCYWTGEYGHGSAKAFVEDSQEILNDEDRIMTFIFTNHQAYGTESHYDG